MNLHGHPSWDACILITSRNPDNRRFGTGFIIYHSGQKSYVVTCAHVISDVGGEELIEADGQPARIVGIGSDDGLNSLGKKIKNYFEHIFVISHNPLIRNWSDNIIMIKKEDNVSSIDYITSRMNY